MSKSYSLVLTTFVSVAALSSVACAPMSVGAPVVTDVPVGTERRSNLTGAREGSVAQDGVRVSAHVAELCDVQQVDTVERTTVREHKNDAPQNDWWAGIGGGVLVGAGALAVASPATVQPKDKDTSEKEIRGTGYALIGVGALLLAVPVIDYVRAHRVAEHKVERVALPGPTLHRNVQCSAAPAGTPVYARYPGDRKELLGSLDAQGNLDVDLDRTTPADWTFAKDARATLFSEKGDLGVVSLTPLYQARDAAAWRLAEASPCTTSVDENACDAYATYGRSYPDGDHISEVRLALDEASSRRRVAAEEAAWSGLDVRVCRTAKADMDAIEAACGALWQYVADFPEGGHVVAVREALLPVQAIYARLEAAEQREDGQESASVGSSGAFIPYAGNGGGLTLCADGMMSHSSGRGTCSGHGGVSGGSSRRTTRTRRAPATHSSSGHSSSGGHASSGGHSSGGRRSGGRRK